MMMPCQVSVVDFGGYTRHVDLQQLATHQVFLWQDKSFSWEILLHAISYALYGKMFFGLQKAPQCTRNSVVVLICAEKEKYFQIVRKLEEVSVYEGKAFTQKKSIQTDEVGVALFGLSYEAFCRQSLCTRQKSLDEIEKIRKIHHPVPILPAAWRIKQKVVRHKRFAKLCLAYQESTIAYQQAQEFEITCMEKVEFLRKELSQAKAFLNIKAEKKTQFSEHLQKVEGWENRLQIVQSCEEKLLKLVSLRTKLDLLRMEALKYAEQLAMEADEALSQKLQLCEAKCMQLEYQIEQEGHEIFVKYRYRDWEGIRLKKKLKEVSHVSHLLPKLETEIHMLQTKIKQLEIKLEYANKELEQAQENCIQWRQRNIDLEQKLCRYDKMQVWRKLFLDVLKKQDFSILEIEVAQIERQQNHQVSPEQKIFVERINQALQKVGQYMLQVEAQTYAIVCGTQTYTWENAPRLVQILLMTSIHYAQEIQLPFLFVEIETEDTLQDIYPAFSGLCEQYCMIGFVE